MSDHRQPVVVFVPYRDRPKGWAAFLERVRPLFPPGSVVIRARQSENGRFNKGKLLNAAFTWWTKTLRDEGKRYEIILQDVDTIPMDECTRSRYKAEAGDGILSFYTPVKVALGGVARMAALNFELMNGFPNGYWGWGSEDNVLMMRAKAHGIPVTLLQVGQKTTAGWWFVDEPGGRSDKSNFPEVAGMAEVVRLMSDADRCAECSRDGLDTCDFEVVSATTLDDAPDVWDVLLDLKPPTDPPRVYIVASNPDMPSSLLRRVGEDRNAVVVVMNDPVALSIEPPLLVHPHLHYVARVPDADTDTTPKGQPCIQWDKFAAVPVSSWERVVALIYVKRGERTRECTRSIARHAGYAFRGAYQTDELRRRTPYGMKKSALKPQTGMLAYLHYRERMPGASIILVGFTRWEQSQLTRYHRPPLEKAFFDSMGVPIATTASELEEALRDVRVVG
jgi:hypothetical protein